MLRPLNGISHKINSKHNFLKGLLFLLFIPSGISCSITLIADSKSSNEILQIQKRDMIISKKENSEVKVIAYQYTGKELLFFLECTNKSGFGMLVVPSQIKVYGYNEKGRKHLLTIDSNSLYLEGKRICTMLDNDLKRFATINEVQIKNSCPRLDEFNWSSMTPPDVYTFINTRNNTIEKILLSSHQNISGAIMVLLEDSYFSKFELDIPVGNDEHTITYMGS